MAKKNNIIPKDNNIIRVPLEEAMPENYLPYAVEVAKERALPDVRDGLKPVHRRILYGAYMLKAFPDKPYYKSARIVGDILGKFHPHGDSSVYDAMVILAQNFSTREPLIDGHGNWGSIDGDGAAAMRYTEARLSNISMEMLKDIEKGVVDMVSNYSDSDVEPKVLPARYPNLLVNGAFGIAVGLATNIPPHNLGEVCDGTLAYIDNPEITTKELMNYIKAPDLPTGGVIIGKNSLISAYETGEGKVTLRAKTSIERLENGRLGIVITEFPYRRNKARLLQTISEMTGDKRHSKALESITDIRDESDRTGIRAVIEFKKSVDEETADKVLKYLFKKTDLQCNISFNMVALAEGKPETMGLKTIIGHYVNHQKDVITRRTKRELDIAEKRFHVVEGFIKAIDIIDEIIAEIRASKSKKEAAEKLINKFQFTSIQAEAILELMLYRLTGLEINVFKKEYKELEKTIKRLKKILESEKELLKVIKTELIEIKDKYFSPRRTDIVEDESEAKINLEELIVVEDIMVTLSEEGFIKRTPIKSYNRSNSDASDIEYREGDSLKYLFKSNTKDTIVIFTDKGNMYQIKGNSIPECRWKEKGERIDSLIRGLNLEDEKIISVQSIENFTPNKAFQFITKKGFIKKTSLDKFITGYTKLMALKLKDSDKLLYVRFIDVNEEEKFIYVKTKKNIEFYIEEPKLDIVDRNILGTEICNLTSEDEIVNIEFKDEYKYEEFILGVSRKGKVKIYSRLSSDSYNKVRTSSGEFILAFSNKGNVYKFPSFMAQNIKEPLDISNFVDGFKKDEEILLVVSEKSFNEDNYIYFFTKNGLIKKTMMKDFEGSYNNQMAYRFKTEDDILVSIEYSSKEKNHIVIVTKKGMGIKFESENVNPMGRVASGVTGISLKDEDEVVYGNVISVFFNKEYNEGNEIAATYDGYEKLILISKNEDIKETYINNIKLQNRAGRGNSLIVLIMDDYVKEVVLT
ncbi:DNA topoisomerase IV subunit A [Clostridium fallax]|uniref:DNA topoisomerase (ATP-hydrolyzing) n=1 Tax=Clostridium fallax TaxID=1533 RepID=A0A1M4UNJ9_9CLOT|nr:DNA topoisomerase IV subunit A [Clostridium fallax]SHE58341.1 DNA topoisomerase IV subunit A [Clostridium fallax]SQB07663.1 DNA topoisomerase IV subunit A [Clostridium fallax]